MRKPILPITAILILLAHTHARAQVAITTVPTQPPSGQTDGQHQVKRNFSHRDLPPLNLDMFALSTQTGGEFYFWGEGEFGSEAASKVIAESVLSTQTLLYKYGDIDGTCEIPFYVEKYKYHFTFFTGIQSKDRIEFIQPDGTVLKDGEGVTVYPFQRMCIATVNAPLAGEWTIRLSGRGKYLVSVRK